MWKYNIIANLARTIMQLYDKDTSAIQMKSSTGEGSEQQLELGKDAFCHPLSSILFSKSYWLMLWKNKVESLTLVAEILPLSGLPMTYML